MSASGYQQKVPPHVHEENVKKLDKLLQELKIVEDACEILEWLQSSIIRRGSSLAVMCSLVPLINLPSKRPSKGNNIFSLVNQSLLNFVQCLKIIKTIKRRWFYNPTLVLNVRSFFFCLTKRKIFYLVSKISSFKLWKFILIFLPKNWDVLM